MTGRKGEWLCPFVVQFYIQSHKTERLMTIKQTIRRLVLVCALHSSKSKDPISSGESHQRIQFIE